MKINEVAQLTKVSVRTLQHYDKIGLLCPKREKENGYRNYTEVELDLLQQILLFKQCGFSLEKIRDFLNRDDFSKIEAYLIQKKYLEHEKKRIETMLKTLNKSIQLEKGEITMTTTEKFEGFNMDQNPYEQQARSIWGDDIVDQSNAYLMSQSEQERNNISQSMDDLFRKLATITTKSLYSQEVQSAMEEMYQHFNKNFGYHYSLEAFAMLGQMYIEDERFTKNIDQYKDGLAAFLSKAMKVYAQQPQR